MSYCSRSCWRPFTVVGLYTAILNNICTAPAQKRLLVNFWCKLWHRGSIFLLVFPVRVQNFGDLATFPFDFFCISYAECQPYFYCRFVWPTDLESIPHYHTRRLLRRFVCWYVTWPWPLTFWPWSVLIHGGARVQPCHQVWRPYAYPFLSYEL